MAALHERLSSRREHADLRINGLAEVLCLDQGMLPSQPGDGSVHEIAIGWYTFAHIFRREKEHPPFVIPGLGFLGPLVFPLQQCVAGPARARKQPGGVGAGYHRLHVFVILERADILGLIHHQ